MTSSVQCCIILRGSWGAHAMSFGNFVGYTSISWTHYGSLESLGVALAPTKIECEKIFLTEENIFLSPGAGPARLAA